MSKSKFRAASLVAAGLIAFSGVSMPSVALAQAPGIASPTYTTVDMNQPVSITVLKKLGDPGGQNLPPGPNAIFKLEKIQLNNDLSTAAGWAEVSTLTIENAPVVPSSEVTQTTDSSGTAIFSRDANNAQLTPGVYKITEQARSGFTVAKPFLVTLPFVENGVWKYDQTVQPKNQTIQPEKRVADEGKTIGDIVTFTIDSGVPAENISSFEIVDDLVTQLGYVEDPTVSIVKPGTIEGLQHNTDYEVTSPAVGQSGRVTVKFLPSGLQKLQEARRNNPELKVQVDLKAKILSVPANGNIANTAVVNLPGGSSTSTVKDGDPGTETKLGPLTITKTVNPADPAANLTGAKFKVYLCQQDGNNQGRWTVQGQPIRAAKENRDGAETTDEFTIENGNTVTLHGMQAYDWKNDAEDNTRRYCVVETQAPAGFNLNPEPQPVTYERDPKTVNDGTNPYNMVATVLDQKDSIIGQLPATGEKGVFALMVAGLALLGGGVWARLRHNRKQTNA